MRFSEAQNRIICGKGNMLVSASAGSGKTTVMIEKIRRLIENGASLDNMLISTYTVAAASDMKYKLAAALTGGDAHMSDELERLPQADIGTLHSFCARLIKSYFYLTDADPAFELAGEAEAAAMKQESAAETVARGGGERFPVLYDALLSGRSDAPLKNLLISLYEFAQSQPDPDGWLDGCLELYERPETVRAALSAAFDERRDVLSARARTLLADTCAAKYTRNIRSCEGLEDYIRWGVPPAAARGAVGDHPDLNERYKSLKKDIEGYRAERTEAENLPDAAEALADARELVMLVRAFARAYDALKRKKGLLDYGDLEHCALEILTAGGAEIAGKYKYVFVDEYQDINPLQERIIELISAEAELFQVGDVKQSIYAFRLCEPGIFLRRYAAYRRGEGGEAVELNVNYRSDGGVLQAVNRVFSRIMTADCGGVDYAKTPLTAGRNERTADAVALKVLCGEEAEEFPEVYSVLSDRGAKISGEAAMVAADIAETLTLSREGRPVRPEDVAVIMRSRSPLMYRIAEALRCLGIPAAVCAKERPEGSAAVRPLLNALRLLDNREDDVMLASVMLSPFGGFTADELAAIRAGREGSFCEAAAAYDGALRPRLDAFEQKLDRYHGLSKVMPADELAGLIAGEAQYFEYLYAQENGRALAAEAAAFLSAVSASGHTAALDDFIEYAAGVPAAEKTTAAGAVRIMTVHAAKGLEFDYVFFAGAETRFRFDDVSKPAMPHREFGLCVRKFDDAARALQKTKLTELAAITKKKGMLEEEMRILYVALTRARERLYIYGKRSKRYEGEDLSAVCNLNWLLPAFPAVEYVSPDECALSPPERVRLVSRSDPALTEEIRKRLAFVYPHSHRPQKTTVTKAAEAAEERNYAAESVSCDGERAALVGTAYHLMMEHVDFSADFDREWERLGRAFPEERALCDKEKIRSAALEMRSLSEGYRVYREKEFILGENGLLIQGIIDALLIKNGEAIIVDYKTTRARDLVLPQYVFQTGLYARAAEKLLGLTVKRVCLYSFYLGKIVDIPYTSENA